MPGNVISGGRRLQLYTGTFTSSPTSIAANAALTLTEQISTDVSRDDAGVLTITLEQIDATSTFYTFLRTYASPADGKAPEDITYEDNVDLLGAANVGAKFLALVRGGLVSGGPDAGKRMSVAAVVSVARSSGSFSQSGGTYARPSLALTSYPLDYNVVIPSTYLTCYMTTAAAVTLDAEMDKHGRIIHG
jgi:hypothetical protein